MKKNYCNLLAACSAGLLAITSAEASTVFINFMTNQGSGNNANPMDASQAAALGAANFANVDVQGTGSLPRTWSNVAGVSGTVTYADWWQSGMKSSLYDGGNNPDQGFTGGVVAINGTHAGQTTTSFSSTITLDLTSYLANLTGNNYQIQIFYGGRLQNGFDALTDSDNTIVNLNDGTNSFSDYAQTSLLEVTSGSNLFWSGRGEVFTFDDTVDSLTITTDSVSSSESGIAGILIVPEPSTALLCGLGLFAFMRRSRQ